MDYSAESIRYLHIAYTILIGAQIAYAAWLITRYQRTAARLRQLRHTD